MQHRGQPGAQCLRRCAALTKAASEATETAKSLVIIGQGAINEADGEAVLSQAMKLAEACKRPARASSRPTCLPSSWRMPRLASKACQRPS